LIQYTGRILVPLLPFEVKEQKKKSPFSSQYPAWFPIASQDKPAIAAILKPLRGTPAARLNSPPSQTVRRQSY